MPSLKAIAAGALLFFGEIARVQAKYTCDSSLGGFYSYCVNVPDNASGKLPTILMLSGSGARNDGDSSKVKSLVRRGLCSQKRRTLMLGHTVGLRWVR